MRYKKEIIRSDSRIKKHTVWITTAEKLKHIMTPNSLYTYVTCNRFRIRTKLNESLCEDLCFQEDDDNVGKKQKYQIYPNH